MSVRAKRGGPCGRKSSQSWQAWKQAPPGLRRWRGTAECGGDRGQRHRHRHVPAIVEDIPPIRMPAGRRRTRPAKVHADKGYDSRVNRAYLRRRGIKARIARAWGGVLGAAGAAPLEGRAVAELLAATAGAVGPGRGAVVCLRAGGLCAGVLQPAVGPDLEDHWCAAGPLAALAAGYEGRSHSDAWVGCMVWSTTASSSTVNVSRSTCWRSRALNAAIVWAAS
jgi:hypothetical protein